MHITYIIKKGLKCYPPALAQVLFLNDLGVDITVYHGHDTDYINNMLEKRKIKHHILKSDNDRNDKISSILKLVKYQIEIRKILKIIPKDDVIWFGNCESALGLETHLRGRFFIYSILELYTNNTWIEKKMRKIISNANIVTCCEIHRAEIMRSMYKLKRNPYVLQNKPYELYFNDNEKNKYNDIIEFMKKNHVVIYQGMIHRDRPLLNIARALKLINNKDLYFCIIGSGDENLIEEVKTEYNNTKYYGYIPNPEHLILTQHADVGIANYDFRNLNNVFCAPNKIFEYAKFNIPMIASENIGLLETVGKFNAGKCVDFDNVDEIESAVREIFRNYATYQKGVREMYNSVDNLLVINRILNEVRFFMSASTD